MPLSEYSDSVGGGLKLKGVKDGRVKKQKKKERKAAAAEEPTGVENNAEDKEGQRDPVKDDGKTVARIEGANKYGKTEAQLRHEERKRQLMEERIKKEGVKTHKERVEELNKYLSRLSEHHDMPKIGPG